MGLAQDPLAVGEGALVQGDRLIGAARGLVGDGEVVAGGQRVGVIGAKGPVPINDQPLAEHDGLRRVVSELAQESECPPSEPDHLSIEVTAGAGIDWRTHPGP